MRKNKNKGQIPKTQTGEEKGEKRFLTEIQKLLLMEKSEKLQLALATVEQRRQEFSRVVTLCSRELGIPDEEDWTLSENLEYFLKKNGSKGG